MKKTIKSGGTLFRGKFGVIECSCWVPGDVDPLKHLEGVEKREAEMQVWRKRQLRQVRREFFKSNLFYEKGLGQHAEGLRLLRKEIARLKRLSTSNHCT